ncbi:MAG: hypothetical protein JNL62_29565, partial [Bryobacterales bacterium]|nr:hypothetical protein [Bryobacterales bacterium]
DRTEWRPGLIDNPAQYEGQYRSDEALAEFTIRYFDSRLTLEQSGQTIGELAATGPDRFQAGAINILIERDANKQIQSMRLTTGRVRKLPFMRFSSTP